MSNKIYSLIDTTDFLKKQEIVNNIYHFITQGAWEVTHISILNSFNAGYNSATLDPRFTADIKGHMRVTDDSLLCGNVSINGSLNVGKDSHIFANISIDGTIYLGGNLIFMTDTTLILNNLIVKDDIDVYKNTSLNNLYVTNNASFNSNVIVSSNISCNSLYVNTNISSNHLYVNTNISSNSLYVTTNISSNSLFVNTNISTTNLYSYGNSSLNNLIVYNISTTNLYSCGNSSLNNLIVYNASITELNVVDVANLNQLNINGGLNVNNGLTLLQNVSILGEAYIQNGLNISGLSPFLCITQDTSQESSIIFNIDNYGNTNISGNLGIGYTNTSSLFALDVSGNMKLSQHLLIGGNITHYSDSRLKENITPLTKCLDKINSIHGYSFTRNDLPNTTKKHIGLIAQEVELLFPELVIETNNIKSINYQSFSAILIECVKELNEKIKLLENKILS